MINEINGMNEKDMNNLLQCARGCWQYGIVKDLIRYKEIDNPIAQLRGKAKDYSGRYKRSFDTLIDRIENYGYDINVKLGRNGGYTTAKYRITKAN